MNCKQLNTIALEEVLRALGHLPTKQTEKEAWYLNPFAVESQASFKVDRPMNLWYLFSEGAGGTTTDFMQKYLNTSVKGVLEWASQQNFSSFHQQINSSIRKVSPEYRIEKVIALTNPKLINYLRDRGLSSKVDRYVKEIWYTNKDKHYYTIGFQNRSGGWELRNPYHKGSLLNKDISILQISPAIKNAENLKVYPDRALAVSHDNIPDRKVVVLEGFMDALSFIELKSNYQGDLLVLNSASLLKLAIKLLKGYNEISLFLDNDKAGRKCTKEIVKAYPHAKDFSNIYSEHKDLNEYLMEKRGQKFVATPKTESAAKQENECAEKQESCKEEKNRPTKGLRRRM